MEWTEVGGEERVVGVEMEIVEGEGEEGEIEVIEIRATKAEVLRVAEKIGEVRGAIEGEVGEAIEEVVEEAIEEVAEEVIEGATEEAVGEAIEEAAEEVTGAKGEAIETKEIKIIREEIEEEETRKKGQNGELIIKEIVIEIIMIEAEVIERTIHKFRKANLELVKIKINQIHCKFLFFRINLKCNTNVSGGLSSRFVKASN